NQCSESWGESARLARANAQNGPASLVYPVPNRNDRRRRVESRSEANHLEFRGTVSYGTTNRRRKLRRCAAGGVGELVDGMSLKMPSILPPKRDVAVALLDRASVF